MKNHFFIHYTGNKRNEVNTIYENILLKPNITTIIEPYCGTSAMSFYIWTKNKDKNYHYILNDNNNYLIDLYNIAKDEIKLKKLYNDLQKIYNDIFNLETEQKKKEAYDKLKLSDNVENWLFLHKIFNVRIGLFPQLDKNGKKRCSLKTLDSIINAPIIEFLRTANITTVNNNAMDLYKQYKDNENAFIFLDPPYIISHNSDYKTPTLEIYEYLCNNKITDSKAYIILCLENTWIIKLLFNGCTMIVYGKKYEATKKLTEHVIIKNM